MSRKVHNQNDERQFSLRLLENFPKLAFDRFDFDPAAFVTAMWLGLLFRLRRNGHGGDDGSAEKDSAGSLSGGSALWPGTKKLPRVSTHLA